MKFRPLVPLAAGAALLSACGSDAPTEETASEAERDAKGEVLGGTISDDMLPLDRLRSQSPPLREERSAATDAPSSSEATAEVDNGADEGEAIVEEAGDPVEDAPAEG